MTNEKIVFSDGTEFPAALYPVETEPCIFIKRCAVEGCQREVLRMTVRGDISAVRQAFAAMPFSIAADDGEVYDKSEYCVMGDCVCHSDGRVTVYMGKKTAEELRSEQLLFENASLFFTLKTGGELCD